MKNLILLLTITALVSGCSIEKRATKAINRIGSKPILKVLVLEHPELFTHTDSVVTVYIHDTILVSIKSIEHDTVLINQPCEALNYNDNKISISFYNGHLNYEIKAFKTKYIFTKEVKAAHTCKPCPTIQIAQDIKNDFILKSVPTWWETLYKWWFWFTIALIVAFIIWHLKRLTDILRP